MAGHVEKVDAATAWQGGRSPFNVTYGKMMMWFFLVSDALTFGGFLIALGFAKISADAWPVADKVFFHFPFVPHSFPMPLIYVALMTFILIVSSVTMVLAVEAGHRMDKKGVQKWLGWTIVGGAIFLGSQAWEWYTFISGIHVFTGVIVNIVVWLQVKKGIMHERGHYEMVEKVGLYWHFVDLVWVFVFTFFYLV